MVAMTHGMGEGCLILRSESELRAFPLDLVPTGISPMGNPPTGPATMNSPTTRAMHVSIASPTTMAMHVTMHTHATMHSLTTMATHVTMHRRVTMNTRETMNTPVTQIACGKTTLGMTRQMSEQGMSMQGMSPSAWNPLARNPLARTLLGSADGRHPQNILDTSSHRGIHSVAHPEMRTPSRSAQNTPSSAAQSAPRGAPGGALQGAPHGVTQGAACSSASPNAGPNAAQRLRTWGVVDTPPALNDRSDALPASPRPPRVPTLLPLDLYLKSWPTLPVYTGRLGEDLQRRIKEEGGLEGFSLDARRAWRARVRPLIEAFAAGELTRLQLRTYLLQLIQEGLTGLGFPSDRECTSQRGALLQSVQSYLHAQPRAHLQWAHMIQTLSEAQKHACAPSPATLRAHLQWTQAWALGEPLILRKTPASGRTVYAGQPATHPYEPAYTPPHITAPSFDPHAGPQAPAYLNLTHPTVPPTHRPLPTTLQPIAALHPKIRKLLPYTGLSQTALSGYSLGVYRPSAGTGYYREGMGMSQGYRFVYPLEPKAMPGQRIQPRGAPRILA